MTPESAAAVLNGNEYRNEGSKEFFMAMKQFGLVAVFGASDDLMEIEGAFREEVGCYGGGAVYLTSDGPLVNDCRDHDCPHFEKLKEKAATIHAKWDDGGFSWRYETDIPHAKFIIKEDGKNYCEGIVFALADVRTP